MSNGFNKQTVIGNLARDGELKRAPNDGGNSGSGQPAADNAGSDEPAPEDESIPF